MNRAHAPALRGAFALDQLQPQLAACLAVRSGGYLPVPGETAFWLEVEPGMAANTALDAALKHGDVRPGLLVTERLYGTLEVHGPDQGQVRSAGAAALRKLGLDPGSGMAPEVLQHEIIRKLDAHHAALLGREGCGMLALAGDALFTLEVTPAVWICLAANQAEKAAPIRLVDIEGTGAVGRLRLAGDDASVEAAAAAALDALDTTSSREP